MLKSYNTIIHDTCYVALFKGISPFTCTQDTTNTQQNKKSECSFTRSTELAKQLSIKESMSLKVCLVRSNHCHQHQRIKCGICFSCQITKNILLLWTVYLFIFVVTLFYNCLKKKGFNLSQKSESFVFLLCSVFTMELENKWLGIIQHISRKTCWISDLW